MVFTSKIVNTAKIHQGMGCGDLSVSEVKSVRGIKSLFNNTPGFFKKKKKKKKE